MMHTADRAAGAFVTICLLRVVAAPSLSACSSLDYAEAMQWILLILLAIVVLTVVSFLIAALKWLLIIAAILVFVALVTSATSGRRSSLR